MLRFFSNKIDHAVQGDASILQTMLPSLLGLALCVVCLTGTTWAWFTITTSSNIETLNTAVFSSTVTVQRLDPDPVGEAISHRAYSDDEGDIPARFTFDRNNTYLITIEPDSSSSASRGYCMISFLDDEGNSVVYRTPVIEKDGSFAFTYQNGINPDGLTLEEEETLLAEPDTLTVVAFWGEFNTSDFGFKKNSSIDVAEIEDGATIGMPPKRVSFTKDFSVGKHIKVENETTKDGTFSATLKVSEGYELPELIEVRINKDIHFVSTTKDKEDGPLFDTKSSKLTIPSELLKADSSGAIRVIVLAEAVEIVVAQEFKTPDADTTPPLSSEIENSDTAESE